MYLMKGDCLERLRELDGDSIDSVVTNPPSTQENCEIWKECQRVLKPNGSIVKIYGTSFDDSQEFVSFLCRLVTTPGGVVLDPFMGSGTTGKAAMAEGFDFIGIEERSSCG